MKLVLEKDIESRVVAWATKKDFLCPKFQSSENGWPDRLFISPYGHTIFIEFKRPGEKPRKLQLYRISEIIKRGIPAFYCDSVADAIEILEAALDPENLPKASDPASPQSDVCRVVSRSGPRQDVDGPCYDQDPVGEEVREAYTYSSPLTSSTEGMAGRDREVGGISPPTLDGAPWDPEGGKT